MPLLPFCSRRDTLKLALCTALAAGSALGAAPAWANDPYPSKPIKLVVPYPPGGGTDALARVLSAKLSESWKVPVVVENKTGASGMLGNDLVAKAAPDGYTVLVGITALIQGPALFSKLPYDPVKDFVPLTAIARSADLLLVPADFPASTVQEFVALVKANPRKYSIGNYGNGTSSHIHAVMLGSQAKLELNHVPYRGAGPLLTDLLGGQVSSAFVDSSSATPHLGGGKLKVLAVSGARSSPLAPKAPTLTSLGYQSFEPYGWFGLFTPAATPEGINKRLADEFVRIIKLPDVQERLQGMGLLPGGNPMDEFAREVKSDKDVWAKVITEAQIKLD